MRTYAMLEKTVYAQLSLSPPFSEKNSLEVCRSQDSASVGGHMNKWSRSGSILGTLYSS